MNTEFQSDRLEAAKWAADYLSLPGQAVLILDTETTGFEGEVIELSIIDLAGQVKFNSRFKPILKVEDGARRVHGLSAEMLEDCPLWEDKADEIGYLLGSAYTVLIYNQAFDVPRLAHTCHLHNVPTFKFRSDCIMMMYAQFFGEWNDYHGNYRWQRLPAGDHTALGDCMSALAILKTMAAQANGNLTPSPDGDGQ